MSKINYIQTNWTAGEFSKQLKGRTDIEKYLNAGEKIENFYLKSFGGAFRRPGTYYAAEVKDSTKATRLLSFQFSTTQAYILEFGDLYVRFYKDNGQIQAAGSAVEVTTTYTEAELFELQFAQSADTLYIVHKNHVPAKLTRTSHVDWTLTDITFTGGPFTATNTSATTIAMSALTGTITLTSSTSIFAASGTDIDDYTKAIMHFDGTDGSATMTDEIGHAWTTAGNAQIDTAQKKFGTGSLKLDGIGDYITTGDHADWNFSTGDFTIDYWVRFDDFTQVQHFMSQEDDATHYWRAWINTAKVAAIRFVDGTTKADYETGELTSLVANTQYHFEWSRNGPTMELRINGVSQALTINTAISTNDVGDIAGTLDIGQSSLSAGENLKGYMDELRISKGIARHTEDFTPNTNAYDAGGKVGALLKISSSYVTITAVATPSGATATVNVALTSTAATTVWAWGAWSPENGYPSCVTFHEERLWFGSSINEPQTVWGSVVSDFENFLAGASADDALAWTISDNQVNAIRWLVSTKVLNIGTIGGGFTLSSGSDSVPLTPTNVLIKRETSYGSALIMPKRIENHVYYMQRNARTMREFVYNFDSDAYLSDDMTVLAEHITESGIVDMDYQESPDNVIWCVRDDGEIACLTRQIKHEVAAWTRVKTDGNFESVAVIPKGEEDQVWVVVNRTIDGSTARYIEYFKPFNVPDDYNDVFHVDCGLTYSGTSAQIMSGLTHLKGETVTILADGAAHDTKVVSAGGVVTLDNSYSYVHIGLAFTSKLKTLPIPADSVIGSAQGLIQRIYHATLRLYKSLGVEAGSVTNWTIKGPTVGVSRDEEWTPLDETVTETANTNVVPFNIPTIATTESPSAYTGDKQLDFPASYHENGSQVYIEYSQPLPLNILAIIYKAEISNN